MFKEILSKNSGQPWKSWLRLKQIFSNGGKQGIVGVMETRENEEVKCVFKISQYVNHLIEHEYAVMNSLNDLANVCPHFCQTYGMIECKVNPLAHGTANPFNIDGKHSVKKSVLLMEHLSPSTKFYNYLKNPSIPEKQIFSVIKQTLLAIAIAQRKKQFTHYDLHSNNVMITKCSRDLVMVYILDEENQFMIPTHGLYPVIIDFGFAYSKGLENGPCWPTLSHTEVGFMSCTFDPVADPKLFLITTSDEIKAYRNSKNAKKYRNIAKNLYGSLDINLESGWDTDTEHSAPDEIIEFFEEYNIGSSLFENYTHFCVDLIQTLIDLPLTVSSNPDALLELSYIAFLTEFKKIEELIGNQFYCLSVLKGIVDVARGVKREYEVKETRENAIRSFKRGVFEKLDEIAKFCNPKLNYEKLLCSLLNIANCMKTILFKAVDRRMTKKKKWYSKLPLQTPEAISTVIDINIRDPYEFTEQTELLVMNCMTNTCETQPINPEWIEKLNDTHPACRGSELYTLLTQRDVQSEIDE
jgi:hypothetical protein